MLHEKPNQPSLSEQAESALLRGLEALSCLVDSVMERSATQRKEPASEYPVEAVCKTSHDAA